MKTKIILAALAMVFFTIASVHAQGKKHDGSKHDHMDMDMSAQKKKMKAEDINPEFKKQLGGIVIKYLVMKDALVNDAATQSKTAARILKSAIGKVNMKLLTDNDHHKSWMMASKMLKKQLDKLINEDNIEKQRALFSKISDDLTNTIQVLGADIKGKTLYLDYCPMANNNAGAYWLSLGKKIQNPYLGQKMPTCGKVKLTLTNN